MIDEAGRIILPTLKFGVYALLPIPLLILLSVTPTHKVSTRCKQAISVPLLTSLLFIPFKYCDEENGSFSVFCQIVPYVMFLRFLDIFWITPLIYKKEAIIAASEFNVEFWSCIRKDLKPYREKKKNGTLVKINDKKFYHLFVPIALNAILFDTLASWAKTFTAEDIWVMYKTSYVQSFLFFWAVVNALTCLLNFAGQCMQLMYCIFVLGGKYSSSEWRLMMNYPLLSLSLEDLWSSRWHRILRPAWVSSAYKPIYFLVRKWTNESSRYKQLAIGLASMAVFVVSGLTHEYVVLCNTGWTLYKERFIGDQMKFFCTHGLLVVLERGVSYIYTHVLKQPAIHSWLTRPILHTYVIGVCYLSFPFFLNGFAHWGLWRLDRITPVEPIIQQYILKPYLKSFCGSLL
ncbi:hypothetical protein BDF21DRAFT_451150 [Thamnidium elegans]|uniref:Wax synthase domain-containing protein n=1 Tax=Thamnidium elegans TaxID=101142 RepID=A0A8H7SFF6_9FUNG|nr:hypothetical protein INT48_007049 [Thamnidium elegans]KAI8083568.1 hypothetical protein BDF21DRAFT_451150 [Thamnidium elegans]